MLENLYTIIEQNQKYIFIKPSKERKLDDFIDYNVPIVQQQQKIQEYINSLHNQETIIVQGEIYDVFKKRVDVIKNEQDVTTNKKYIDLLKLAIRDVNDNEQNLIVECRKTGLLEAVGPQYQKILSFLIYKTIIDTIKYIQTVFSPYKTLQHETIIGNTEGQEIPEVEFDLTSTQIVPDTRRLRQQWNQELAEDLPVYLDLNTEEEITTQLAETIRNEVDQEIVNEFEHGNWYAPAGRTINGGQAALNWMTSRMHEENERNLDNIENEEQFEEYMNRHSGGQRLYPFRTYQEWQQWLNSPPTPITAEWLIPRRRTYQRYARTRVREDFYGTIQVANDEEVLQQLRTIEVHPQQLAEQIRVDFNMFDLQQQSQNQFEVTFRYDEAVLRDLEEHYIIDPVDASLHPHNNIDTEVE